MISEQSANVSGDRVAVIVVNYNAGRHLLRVVEGLAAQDRAPDRVIVIDNGSTDDSLEGLSEAYPSVEIVHAASNLGFAAGNNLGVARATDCEWIAFLNPDAVPHVDWLSELLDAAAKHPSASLLGSTMLVDGQPERLDGTGDVYSRGGIAFRRHHGQPVTAAPHGGDVFGACAAAALIRRSTFMALGGFCEEFFCYYEDVDLAFRIRLAGGSCRYVPDSVVDHVGSLTTGRESSFTLYHSHRNMVWTFVSNMPRGLLIRYLPQHIAANITMVIWYSLQGQPGALLRAKKDALLGLRWALRRRRLIQQQRVATVDSLHHALSPFDWMGAIRRARASFGQPAAVGSTK